MRSSAFPRVVAVLLSALVALGFAGVVASPAASAHTSLVASNPTDGQTLPVFPSQIQLKFDEAIGTPAYVSVVAPDGSQLAQQSLKVESNLVTAVFAADSLMGVHDVNYRVVSADGHTVEGTVHFNVSENASWVDAVPLTPDDVQSPTYEPSPSVTPSPSDFPSETATPTPSPTETATVDTPQTPEPADDGSSLPKVLMVAIAALVVIIVIIIGALVFRRRD